VATLATFQMLASVITTPHHGGILFESRRTLFFGLLVNIFNQYTQSPRANKSHPISFSHSKIVYCSTAYKRRTSTQRTDTRLARKPIQCKIPKTIRATALLAHLARPARAIPHDILTIHNQHAFLHRHLPHSFFSAKQGKLKRC